ncbi:ParA family protein [Meridianimarinicoccus roseus]|jgi:chromosome partitioning protein|uniref:ParA family protein n=1 Tax=Meridianimarinicoccus roseus TaxID=2072018 RepID=A0A2V2LBM6_9RHOB|nr:ParA family protein [Meridianimarinicoccus roseus]PWR02592.1 ParA family protein [Meridianimarinicoccus roseus]
MRVLIFNQKGGVGKTTTAMNLGAALVRDGAGTVVLADLDPQTHLTAGLGYIGQEFDWTVADWIAGTPGAPVPVEAEPGLSLIPGCTDAAPGERPAGQLDSCGADWLLIDAPPTWSPQLAAMMEQCDLVLCPLEPDFLGLQGINRLMRSMQEAALPWSRLRFVLNRVNQRLIVHREVRDRLVKRFGPDTVLPAVVHNSVQLAEAPGHGRTIFGHAPRSRGAADYTRLARHLAALAAPAETLSATERSDAL